MREGAAYVLYAVSPYYSVLLWSLYTTETSSHQPLPFLSSAFSQSTSAALGLTESPPPFVFFSTMKRCRVFLSPDNHPSPLSGDSLGRVANCQGRRRCTVNAPLIKPETGVNMSILLLLLWLAANLSISPTGRRVRLLTGRKLGSLPRDWINGNEWINDVSHVTFCTVFAYVVSTWRQPIWQLSLKIDFLHKRGW